MSGAPARRPRIAWLALAALLAAILLVRGALEGRGPWTTAAARHLRAMKDRTTPPDTLRLFTFQEFASLPRGAPWTTTAPIEARGVRMEGWIQRLGRGWDGDIHVDLVPAPPLPEVPPLDFVTAEITPAWRQGSAGWDDRRLIDALEPRPRTGGGRAMRRVRLSGWLLDDFWNDPLAIPWVWLPHRGSRRVSGWEIHPVTRIEQWQDSLQRFVDIPR